MLLEIESFGRVGLYSNVSGSLRNGNISHSKAPCNSILKNRNQQRFDSVKSRPYLPDLRTSYFKCETVVLQPYFKDDVQIRTYINGFLELLFYRRQLVPSVSVVEMKSKTEYYGLTVIKRSQC